MKNSVKPLLMAACLSLLALPVAAKDAAKPVTTKPKPTAHKTTATQPKKAPQKGVAHVRNGKLTAGEASRLETKEAGFNREERDTRVDNRGRVTSASRTKPTHRKSQATKSAKPRPHAATVAKAHPKSAAEPHAHSPQPHVAGLKTGQLTSRDAARVQTGETSAHQEVRGNSGQEKSKPAEAPDSERPNKAPNPMHLPAHNARMF